MTTNSQLSTAEPEKKKNPMKTNTKQTTRTGTESQRWRSFGGSSEGEWGEKVQGIRSIIHRHKIDGDRLRMLQETEKSKNLYVQPMNMN